MPEPPISEDQPDRLTNREILHRILSDQGPLRLPQLLLAAKKVRPETTPLTISNVLYADKGEWFTRIERGEYGANPIPRIADHGTRLQRASNKREHQFNALCPMPGCEFSARGKVGLLTISNINGHRYIMVIHYNREGGKCHQLAHNVGEILGDRPVKRYKDVVYTDDILSKTLLKAQLRHITITNPTWATFETPYRFPGKVHRKTRPWSGLGSPHVQNVVRIAVRFAYPALPPPRTVPALTGPWLPTLPTVIEPQVRPTVTLCPEVKALRPGFRPSCAYCGSKNVISKGTALRKKGPIPYFQCNACRKKFSPDAISRKKLSDEEKDALIEKVVLYKHSLRALVSEKAAHGKTASVLNGEITRRLKTLPRVIDEADVPAVKVLGVDTTVIKISGVKWRIAYADDAMKSRGVHVKLVKSESKKLITLFLKELKDRGLDAKMYIVDMSSAMLESVAEIAAGLYFIQACLFHLLEDLDAWLPTGKGTWNKVRNAEREKVKLWIPRWVRLPTGLMKRIRKVGVTRERLERWIAFKKVVVLVAYSVTREARERNLRSLREFDSKGDEDIEFARQQVIGRLGYYHTVEEIARFLDVSLIEAFRLQYNNTAESHVKRIKRLQSEMGGFKVKVNTDGYCNAQTLFLNRRQDREAKEAEERAARRGKESKKQRFRVSFPFRYWEDPLDIRALAETLGVEEGLLAEAASSRGYVVAGQHAALFLPKRRIELKREIRSALRTADGGILPVTALSGRMKHFGQLWEKYPLELATCLLVKLGFTVSSTDSGSFVSLG
jgi:transposase-like protein